MIEIKIIGGIINIIGAIFIGYNSRTVWGIVGLLLVGFGSALSNLH